MQGIYGRAEVRTASLTTREKKSRLGGQLAYGGRSMLATVGILERINVLEAPGEFRRVTAWRGQIGGSISTMKGRRVNVVGLARKGSHLLDAAHHNIWPAS